MYCLKCHSPRIIRFLDGFGEWRIFCRNCFESIPITEKHTIKNMKKLTEFMSHISNR